MHTITATATATAITLALAAAPATAATTGRPGTDGLWRTLPPSHDRAQRPTRAPGPDSPNSAGQAPDSHRTHPLSHGSRYARPDRLPTARPTRASSWSTHSPTAGGVTQGLGLPPGKTLWSPNSTSRRNPKVRASAVQAPSSKDHKGE
jgi:hypothetical protein